MLRSPSKKASALCLVVIVAILADLAVLALFQAMPPSLSSGDTPLFIAQSHNPWAHGFEPPGYPLFLSLVLPLGATWTVIAQALISLGAALFTFRRTRMQWLSLAMVACPFLILFDYQLLTETLTCQLVWVGLVLLTWPKRVWDPFIAGLLIGAAALTRDTLYFLPIMLVAATVRTRYFKSALVAAACAFLTILPWQVAHDTSKISDGRGGFALWIGTWERNADWQLPGIPNAAWPANAFRSPAEEQQVKQAIARRDEAPLAAIAIDRIRSDSVAVAKTWALRYPRLWIGSRADSLPLRFERGSVM